MAVDFRCERCGAMLQAKAKAGQRVRCPRCRRKTSVPAALASLPRPHVPHPAGAVAYQELPRGEPVCASAFGGALAGIMPWVLSMCLHVGLFLVMVFLVMVSTGQSPKLPPTVEIYVPPPQMGRMGGFANPQERTVSDGQSDKRTVVRPKENRTTEIDRGETKRKVNLLAPGAEGARSSAQAELGLRDNGVRGGPRFIDIPGLPGVHNVVYVVDRSGSMAASFDDVRVEMIDSIRRLQPHHNFHIVLFGDDRAIEGPRASLVPANAANKNAALRFLRKQRPSGQTTALVALKRAFAVLRRVEKDRPGKLIYLLSDGDFAGVSGGSRYETADGRKLSGNAAVLQWLRDHKGRGEVLINTFLLDNTDRVAVDVLRTIASEHHGRFTHISQGEHP